MQIFKKCLIFILINLIICLSIFFLFSQPSTLKILFNSFNKNNYNTVVVGESHGETAINPYILSEEDNQVFNFSRRLVPPIDFYYIVKEVNSNKKLSRVILEIDSGYWGEQSIQKGVDANLLYSLKNNKVKMEYLFNIFFTKDFTDIFDYKIDKNSIKKMFKNAKVKLNKDYINKNENSIEYTNTILGIGKNYKYLGRGFRYGLHFDNSIKYISNNFNENNISGEAINAFDKLKDYCDKNNIELVCIISALPLIRLENENHDVEHEYFQKFCDERNIKFYDMNYVKDEYLGRKNEDYVDLDGHMQGPLADKQTKVLKEILELEHPEEYFEKNYEDVLKGLKEYENK